MNSSSLMVVPNLLLLDGQGSAVGVPGATAAPAPVNSTPTTATTSAPGGTAGNQTLPATGSQPSLLSSLLVPLGMLVFVIVIFVVPQFRQNKQRQQMIASVKKGDKVSTTGGVIGTIVELTNDEMVLAVEQGRIRFARSALAGVVRSTKELADSKIEAKSVEVKV